MILANCQTTLFFFFFSDYHWEPRVLRRGRLCSHGNIYFFCGCPDFPYSWKQTLSIGLSLGQVGIHPSHRMKYSLIPILLPGGRCWWMCMWRGEARFPEPSAVLCQDPAMHGSSSANRRGRCVGAEVPRKWWEWASSLSCFKKCDRNYQQWCCRVEPQTHQRTWGLGCSRDRQL